MKIKSEVPLGDTPCSALGICDAPLLYGVPDAFLNNDGIDPINIPERLRHIVWGLINMDKENPLKDKFSIVMMSGVLANIAHIMPWDGTCDKERSQIRWWICTNDPKSAMPGREIPNGCRSTQQSLPDRS